MQYRQLGRSGLRVSAFTLGTMGFGGTGWATPVGKIGVDGAREQIAIARDAGVNLIDTADVYSAGLAEEILGQALGGAVRKLAPRTMTSGRVRDVGVSNFAAWQMMKGLAISDARQLERFASTQVYYSLQSRDIEAEIVPACLDQGVGILVWSPLAGGLLSGKYRRGVTAPAGSRHLSEWDEPPVHDEDKLYDTIELAVKIGESHGVSAARVALAYLTRKPGVASLIVGARTPEQLRDNLAAADLDLTADEVAALDDVSGEPLRYPFWHQANTSADRLSPADLSQIARHLR